MCSDVILNLALTNSPCPVLFLLFHGFFLEKTLWVSLYQIDWVYLSKYFKYLKIQENKRK